MTDVEQQPLTTDEQDIVQACVTQLFDTLEVDGSFEATFGEGSADILLDTKDTGIVIGYHGETLEALQLILSLMATQKIGRFVRISIEVGDYKKNRSEYLERLAQQAKERALEEHGEQVISSLKSWERRVIHMLLQNDEEVVSESAGEGKERVLIVKPRE